MTKPIWFKAKAHGYGWTPATWQGWLILFSCIALNILVCVSAVVLLLRDWTTIIGFIILFIVVNSLFMYICFKTGEPVKWQGDKPRPW